jgi:hypothetical protein
MHVIFGMAQKNKRVMNFINLVCFTENIMYLILHINKGGKPILNFLDFSFSFFFYISFQINIFILQTDFKKQFLIK